jgi:D-alanyl-D-alanine carboxypeptidase
LKYSLHHHRHCRDRPFHENDSGHLALNDKEDSMHRLICFLFSFLLLLPVALTPDQAFAKRGRAPSHGTINSRSAILVDMGDGRILYEQNPDASIAPASITKVLTLYIVFEALRDGRLRPWENVRVSSRAAQTGGSRMGLKTGHIVAVEELVKGMAVVSGNDACVAIAEHMSGTVEEFVHVMNNKARELGMSHSHFTTPNGLPAPGQYTTARDIAKLSVAYLRRFPESLNIHSMQSYTYRTTTHRNANRLLATCPGVDGLKTGFVCAAGYNLSATCKRGETRLLAVVLGAPSSGVRATETARLLEMGYQAIASGSPVIRMEEEIRVASDRSPAGEEGSRRVSGRSSGVKRLAVAQGARSERNDRGSKRGQAAQSVRTAPSTQHQIATGTCAPTQSSGTVSAGKGRAGSKEKVAAKGVTSGPQPRSVNPIDSSRKGAADKKLAIANPQTSGKTTTKQAEPAPAKEVSKSTKSSSSRSKNIIQGSDKPPAIAKSKKQSTAAPKKGESDSASSTAAKKKSTP